MVSHPSARELPGTSMPRVVKRLGRRAAERAHVTVEDLQHVARVLATGGRRTEEARVTGRSTEDGGILIVDLTDE